MTLRMDDVHDLREPGRVSVSRTQLEETLEELSRAQRLALDRFSESVRLRRELDEARKELVRERALHRLEQAEQVITRADDLEVF